MAKPQELMYIAIERVAPSAKLNQQRARRYRSAQEGEIERTVYDAHKYAFETEQQTDDGGMTEAYESSSATLLGSEKFNTDTHHEGEEGGTGSSGLREVEPGRFQCF